MKKEVKTKWQTEGSLAVIYNVDGILLFYNIEKDPRYKPGQKLTQQEAEESGAYKALSYSNENIPPDAIIDLNFAWSRK